MSENENTQDPKLVELLAYTLYMNFQNDTVASKEAWQDSVDLRSDWRQRARFVWSSLSAAGAKLSVSQGRKLDSFVSELAVVPARLAYYLEETGASGQ
jgi:hypothetical protein